MTILLKIIITEVSVSTYEFELWIVDEAYDSYRLLAEKVFKVIFLGETVMDPTSNHRSIYKPYFALVEYSPESKCQLICFYNWLLWHVEAFTDYR